MDTRALQLFLNLAETRSFSRTAEQLHMSLSAVSRTLQRIEAEVGQRLFERDKRSVRITRAGERFREYADHSLAEWQRLAGDLRLDAQDLRGEVSVYCSVTASYSVLSPILERFRAAYPGIEIMLHTGDQADAVGRIHEGREDIAVAACPDKLPGKIEFLTLLHSPLQFIGPAIECSVSEQLAALAAAAEGIGWSDIPFIVAERGLSKERVDAWFRIRGERPRIYAQVAGHEAIAAMVGLGLGVGVVPQLVLDNSTYRDKLTAISVSPALGAFPVGLCATGQRLENPLVAAFWEVARHSYIDTK
ncbi:MAG: HTH-type transcriptional activator IlvY [Halieaceae bacterium]